eukprot:TRINITY_DN34095_c0_g1_i2.p1 TRINITY_DN34095_c0_g1~~TRINITY_DN34095_c0_g1_i2.p1  ORF type:complete len:486 (-),score=8.77 TRINITY_DN34095_c0_g1_i2:72-1529(-)
MNCFQELEWSIMQRIIAHSGFCNPKWKIRQKLRLRNLSKSLLQKMNSKITSLRMNSTFDFKQRRMVKNYTFLENNPVFKNSVCQQFPNLQKIVMKDKFSEVAHLLLLYKDALQEISTRNISIEFSKFEVARQLPAFLNDIQIRLVLRLVVVDELDVQKLLHIVSQQKSSKLYLQMQNTNEIFNIDQLFRIKDSIVSLDIQESPNLCKGEFLQRFLESRNQCLHEIFLPSGVNWNQASSKEWILQTLSDYNQFQSKQTVEIVFNDNNISQFQFNNTQKYATSESIFQQTVIKQECTSLTNLESAINVPISNLVVFKNCIVPSNFSALQNHFAAEATQKITFPYIQQFNAEISKFIRNWTSCMSNLVDLDLKIIGFQFELLKKLGDLKRLKSLSVGYLKNSVVKDLDNFKQIRKLGLTWDVCNTKYSQVAIKFECDLPRLKMLVLSRPKWYPGIVGLNHTPSLERIVLIHQNKKHKQMLESVDDGQK